LNEQSFPSWLRAHLPKFLPSHWRALRRRPLPYLFAFVEAAFMSLAYRRSTWAPPRAVFFKEYLQAGYIADCILSASPPIRRLHAHFCHGATTATMLASRLAGVSFSFTAHAKDIYLRDLNPGGLLARKMRRARFVVTCTEANRKHLLDVCPDGAPVYRIYHGLDPEVFQPDPNRTIPNPGAVPVILSVGRLVEKKGFQYLVQACGLLRDRGVPFTCRIVGGHDAFAPRIRELIQTLDLSAQVVVQNAVTQEELKQIYSSATVFALPCMITESGDRDGIPNVLAEAMAMELPVVSTNISGIPEIVHHGVNGLLAPERDPESLAYAIQMLLENPAYARRLGQSARRTICEVFDSRRNTLALRSLLVGA
jgi:glycosyltransferase involved in cell wall biosynthesis